MANTARARGIARADGFVAYAMDRFLYRLGRSAQASEFYLKGGVLVGNLLDEPFRFSRDIDTLRRFGPPDPEDIRARFEQVIGLPADDGLRFHRVLEQALIQLRDGWADDLVIAAGRRARRFAARRSVLNRLVDAGIAHR